MLGNKSNSKQVLASKKKVGSAGDGKAASSLMRRYKSQEEYYLPPKKATNTEDSTMIIEATETSSFSPKTNSKLIPVIIHTHTGNTKKPSTPSSNKSNRKSSSPEKTVTSKINTFANSKPKQETQKATLSKIMNDESIQELDSDEELSDSIENCDEKQIDEMRATHGVSNFWTNEIEDSPNKKKLINNFPVSFVKPLKNKFSITHEEEINEGNFNNNDESVLTITNTTSNNNILGKLSSNMNINTENANDTSNLVNSNILNNNSINTLNSVSVNNNYLNIEKTLMTVNTLSTLNSNVIVMSEPEKIVTNVQTIDSMHRKLILSAKKGDREATLESLEFITNDDKGDINYRDEIGWTALHYACDEGNLKIVDILTKSNVDLNVKTNNKKTALHLAVYHGYFDISKLLVENGCTVNAVDDEKNNPIHICSIVGHMELLKFLLDKCPQADAKNIYGKTPIDLATKTNIKELLIDYLKKSEAQFTKVHIHTINAKSANILLKTANQHSNQNNSYFKAKTLTSKDKEKENLIKTPIKMANHNSQTHKNVAKFAPHNNINDMSSLSTTSKIFSPNTTAHIANTNTNTTFQNNNININIKVNNNEIKINDKLKVTVETTNNNSNTTNNKVNTSVNNLSIGKNNEKITSDKKTGVSTHRTLQHVTGSKPLMTITKKLLGNTAVVNPNPNSSANKNYTSKILNKSDNTEIKAKSTSKSNKAMIVINKEESSNSKHIVNETHITRQEAITPKKPQQEYLGVNINQSPAINNPNNLSSNYSYTNNNKSPKNKKKHSDNVQTSNVHVIDISENTSNNNSNNNINANTSNLNIKNNSNNVTNNVDHDNYMENEEDIINSSHNNNYSLEEERIGPSNFLCHALLGKGSFGEVYLVEKRNTKTLYAMKVLSKDKIMGQNLVKYAMTERNVLSITNHPFIVKLNYAFQTTDKLFLILDYCPGGDLAEHLARENRFSEERAKIYLCEIVLALEDLHKRDIIFRDLKPDNVVLDPIGHAMLTDFGLSKEGVMDSRSAKSFCGSIAYLAPEMLKRSGHGKAVDWYLLGVLFYEMLIGIPPYFTNNK